MARKPNIVTSSKAATPKAAEVRVAPRNKGHEVVTFHPRAGEATVRNRHGDIVVKPIPVVPPPAMGLMSKSETMPQQVVQELSNQYDFPIKDIADVLDVTPRTFSRWKVHPTPMSTQQADRMMIVHDILELGKKVLGDEEHVKAWLRKPAAALDDQVPLELLKTETGRRKVEEGLYQIYHGFF